MEATTERTVPMRMHKTLVVHVLREHPEDVASLMPGYEDADKAIRALEEHPGEWIVEGVLLTPEQWREIAYRYGEAP